MGLNTKTDLCSSFDNVVHCGCNFD